jgi:streptogramin lyase
VKVVALALVVATAGAAPPPRVFVAGKPGSPVAGKAWTLRLAVRPASFRGAVRVRASGPRRLDVRATGSRGAYRARLVFPATGRWTLTALAGGRTSPLGRVQVRPPPAQPVPFTEPTSIELEPDGTLLLVENNPGRLLRVDPATGRVTVLVPSLPRPYAVVRTAAGAILVSAGSVLETVDGATVAQADADIGPVAAAPDGDVFFTTADRLFRLPGGAGPPLPVAGGLAAPHGLAVAGDGALLVSDTGHDRVLRVAPDGATTTFAAIGSPRGIDVAADGTALVIDSRLGRIVRLSAAGARLGLLGPAFAVPYDLQAAPGGVTYLLEAGPIGWIRRVAADGTVTTVSRR